MSITLAELKEENAAAELAAKNNQVDEGKDSIKDEYVEVDETVKTDDAKSESEDDDKQEVELESWQKTSEENDDDKTSGFVPNHEAAKRRKQAKALKGELKEKDSELDELRKQVESLQQGKAPEVKALTRPTREQFDYDDEAYDTAIDDYYDKKFSQKLNGQLQDNQEQAKQEQNKQAAIANQQKSLDSHYERAQKLVDDGKVTAEAYKNADKQVRESLEAMKPAQGDNIANALISTLNSLGDGSEKVMYQLGANPAKMQELQNRLMADPSGLSASAFLGQLQSQIQSPAKRKSQAPAPGSNVSGEGGNNGKGGTLQKEFSKLSADDAQARISLKRKAKNQGIDVSNW